MALLTMVLIAGTGLLLFAGFAVMAGLNPRVVASMDANLIENLMDQGPRGQFALAGGGLLLLSPLAGLVAGVFALVARW